MNFGPLKKTAESEDFAVPVARVPVLLDELRRNFPPEDVFRWGLRRLVAGDEFLDVLEKLSVTKLVHIRLHLDPS